MLASFSFLFGVGVGMGIFLSAFLNEVVIVAEVGTFCITGFIEAGGGYLYGIDSFEGVFLSHKGNCCRN